MAVFVAVVDKCRDKEHRGFMGKIYYVIVCGKVLVEHGGLLISFSESFLSEKSVPKGFKMKK